jgi:hypothetical protein
MTRRKIEDRNIRKAPQGTLSAYGIHLVFKSGSSCVVTIPLEIIDELKIRKGQKVVVKRVGKRIVIEDWE